MNPDKFGCHTPGTKIPIISETEGHARNPDFLMVMPWHFKANVMQREADLSQTRRETACFRCRKFTPSDVKTSLIIGAGGQDGTFLTELLAQRGDRVIGVSRSKVWSASAENWDAVDILPAGAGVVA